ncbi:MULTISPECIES: M23 family metallopeptidase [Streptomyces]|uniref:M23 family metallopeptidase n=1 Tax=Streptomyces TaxID=1883 RepID=UPI001D0496EF|nr:MULTISPECIES: M23 family metallopeptidase [Streptomyces]
MASNRHASVDSLDAPPRERTTPQEDGYLHAAPYGTHPTYYGPRVTDDEALPEWNPGEETLRPVRGRHRVARQRGGTIARSRAVLGVGVIAAVGAGGMATANDNGAGSVPGMSGAADTVAQLPVLGALVDTGSSEAAASTAVFTTAGLTETEVASGQADAGEALRARILQQADHQETNAETRARAEAVAQAQTAAAEQAAEQAEAERIAEEERQRAEEEERRRQEEERRLAELRASYTLPLSDYRLTSGFGESGSMWQSTHTGTDFAASTGTPVKNVHTGTVKEAAWAGSYGYRIIVELEDGTEIWYCHLSSMNVSTGAEVTTSDVIGTVGSTGNSSGPHLHLEVRPSGGDAIDPLTWLRDKGLSV